MIIRFLNWTLQIYLAQTCKSSEKLSVNNKTYNYRSCYHDTSYNYTYCILTEDSKLLNKVCDDLTNMRVTWEDVLEQDNSIVSSTHSSPVKLPKPASRGRKKSAASRMLEVSKALKDADIMTNVSQSSIDSGSKRALDLFGKRASSPKRPRINSEFDMPEEDDLVQEPSHSNQLQKALDDIAYLKKELEMARSGKLKCK